MPLRWTLLFSLGLATVAGAADERTSESRTTARTNDDGSSTYQRRDSTTRKGQDGAEPSTDVTTETRHTVRNADGGTTTTIARTSTHDGPGTENDRRSESTETITRDSKGTVVKRQASAKVARAPAAAVRGTQGGVVAATLAGPP